MSHHLQSDVNIASYIAIYLLCLPSLAGCDDCEGKLLSAAAALHGGCGVGGRRGGINNAHPARGTTAPGPARQVPPTRSYSTSRRGLEELELRCRAF